METDDDSIDSEACERREDLEFLAKNLKPSPTPGVPSQGPVNTYARGLDTAPDLLDTEHHLDITEHTMETDDEVWRRNYIIRYEASERWDRLRFRLGLAVYIALLLGVFVLPKPYSGWSGVLFVLGIVGLIAFSMAVESTRSLGELLKNTLVVCVVLAALGGYGHDNESDGESYDEDGGITTPWEPSNEDASGSATFDSKAGYAVTLFAKLFAAASLGVYCGNGARPRRDKAADP